MNPSKYNNHVLQRVERVATEKIQEKLKLQRSNQIKSLIEDFSRNDPRKRAEVHDHISLLRKAALNPFSAQENKPKKTKNP